MQSGDDCHWEGGHEGRTTWRRIQVLDPMKPSFLESLKRSKTPPRSLLERLPKLKLSPSKGRVGGRAISSQGRPSSVDTVGETKESGDHHRTLPEGRAMGNSGCWASRQVDERSTGWSPREGTRGHRKALSAVQCCRTRLEHGSRNARLGGSLAVDLEMCKARGHTLAVTERAGL